MSEEKTDRELEEQAQRLGEEALEACYRAAYDEDPPDFDFAGPVCDGPCHTCITREILWATWDPVMELARREVLRDN